MSSISTETIKEYFPDYETLHPTAQAYVLENLRIWAVTGLLHVVALNQGKLELHNQECADPHLACTALSKRNFQNSVSMFQQLGLFGVVERKSSDEIEVRLHTALAHVFGHQLQFEISPAEWTHDILSLYQKRLLKCASIHTRIPANSTQSEMLPREQTNERCFVSARARMTPAEYWAEAIAAFSVKIGRKALKEIDPAMYALLLKLVSQPDKLLKTESAKEVYKFQQSMDVEQLVADVAAL